MIKNYFKVAFRSLIRQKFYAFINILGLTVGLTTSFLIILYVADELSYDQFHEKAEKIHRVTLKGRMAGQEFDGYHTCAPMASIVVDEIPEIEEAVRIAVWDDILIKYEEETYTEKKLLLADSNFFRFFSFELIAGNPDEVLKEPNSIVLSERAAKKYFGYEGPGDDTPLGKMLNVGTGEWLHKVTGIVKNPPSNSHFHFDLVMTMESWDYSRRTQWTSNNLVTYIAINDPKRYKEVEKKFEDLVMKYVGPEVQQYLGISMEEFGEQGGSYGYFLQPLTSIHLHSDLQDELEPAGGIIYVYLLSAIAAFIIVIACINFMNLATARSANRAKEVGIRKTSGAGRGRLITQFLIESMMYSIIAVLLSVGAIFLLLPSFNALAGKELVFSSLFEVNILSGLIIIMLVVGFLAGSYPAFYLTSFNPSQVLKGKVVSGMRSGMIRSILVIVQFTVSIGLIICSLLIYRQLNYVQDRNLGFDKENVLIIQNCRELGDQKNTFQEELSNLNDIISVSISNDYPPHINSNSVHRPVGEDQEDRLFFQYYADFDHQETMGFNMKEGRFFSRDFPSDSLAVVINETAARQIGWEDPIGQKIGDFNEPGAPMDYYEVVGVVSDFNYVTLKQEIEPLIIFLSEWGNLMGVRMTPGNTKEKVEIVENKWKEYVPDAPFEFTFLDGEFDALYRQEQRLGKIFLLFTVLAILVASLGLLGLATFTAEQRSKEIGIRKAMGASIFNVVLLLTKDYTRLIIISFVLSIPASYFIMDWWLENFAYKISIGVISFVAGGLMALLLSWLTVSYQSYKAASVNPVDSLRYE